MYGASAHPSSISIDLVFKRGIIINTIMLTLSTSRYMPRGFTIVELLIVVVVIAILASITIVSYNGISARAKTSHSLATAKEVESKTAVWSSMQSSYPDLAQLRTNTLSPPDIDTPGGGAGPIDAKLSSPSIVMGATLDAANISRANNGATVFYAPCWDGSKLSGGTITYWNFSTNAPVDIRVGSCP